VVQEIEFQRSGDDFGALPRETAALDDIQPCEQLGGAEGLGDVVISSEFECLAP
jgi:hypothetical protein